MTHYTQAAVFALPLAVGALTVTVLAPLVCLLASELALLVIAPHVAGIRKVVDERIRDEAWHRAAGVRATLLYRMAEDHRDELDRLEALSARTRAVTACDGREGDDWLGLDNLVAVFVRLAIAHRENVAAFDADGPERIHAQIVELSVTADFVGDSRVWAARRLAILRHRLEASRQARNVQVLLLAQLATIAETVRWTFEQAALGRSAEAQAGVDDAIAHCAGNGAALREVAALHGETVVDAAALRLGRPRPAPATEPHLRVAVGEPSLHDAVPIDEPIADSLCSYPPLVKQHLELVRGGGSRPT